MRSLLLAISLTVSCVGRGFAADDAELTQKLLSGSPWRPEVNIPSMDIRATYNLIFSKAGDKLRATIEKTSSNQTAMPRADGEVRFLGIKDGQVTYRSQAGATYELKMDGQGNLVGAVIPTRLGAKPGEAILRPSKE